MLPECHAEDITATAWSHIGAVALDVQAPLSSPAGEEFTVTAEVSNPTDAIVHNVRVNGLAAGLPSQTAGDLLPGDSVTLTWTFMPPSTAVGIYSISLSAESNDGGMTLASTSTTLLTPPQLRLPQIDVPERVEIGGS
jgi:hypothetical protein